MFVNGILATRSGAFFHRPVPAGNASGPAAKEITVVVRDGGSVVREYSYTAVVPRAATSPAHDLRGNLLTDGSLWTYQWDARDRLVAAQSGGVAEDKRVRVEFAYDEAGRRTHKTVKRRGGGQWLTDSVTKFVWSGWQMLAELDGLDGDRVVRSYVWGPDVSGAVGAGGGVGVSWPSGCTTGTGTSPTRS